MFQIDIEDSKENDVAGKSGGTAINDFSIEESQQETSLSNKTMSQRLKVSFITVCFPNKLLFL